ncbi:MAG: NAD(P)-binding domain-containing protein [Elusimicrobia bacterium]|jgi:NosR/NirI family nitrous oxide reductase transcriptional regulator|nr:NAD(P)-binding domain-containing protein [Elusimicrobiota bacterium]
MLSLLTRYGRWLHGQWPAGRVEPLPETGPEGQTSLPGVYVVGDLRGIPLLKFAADSGVRAVRRIQEDLRKEPAAPEVLDLLIVGGGVAGMAAALEARKMGLRFEVVEANEPFSTLINFPKGKPIFTYPTSMTPAGDLQFTAMVKEPLVDELRRQTEREGVTLRIARAESVRPSSKGIEVRLEGAEPLFARRVIVALGRSGNFRKMGVPGEDLDKVTNRLHDPAVYKNQNVLVVGGGDSALEAAIALADSGAAVTLSYRGKEITRAKPENIQQLHARASETGVGRVGLRLNTTVQEIRPQEVSLRTSTGTEENVENDVLFSLIGRDPPLSFFKRSGLKLTGEWTRGARWAFAGFFLFCLALYNWKSGGILSGVFYSQGWFPTFLAEWTRPGGIDPKSLGGVLLLSASSPSFYYTLAYSFLVVYFGIRRIRFRQTPYITAQTLTLMVIQIVPLFLLPEILLPWLGGKGWIPASVLDALFPMVNYGHGREYWRAYGFILAWPLMIYNVFTDKPLFGWLAISLVQTFVMIPGLIYFWGKGAYCGWICSCGALAETLGDAHRQKMPHGPRSNRWNFVGQGILALCFILLAWRILGWLLPPESLWNQWFNHAKITYKWGVDVFLAGVVGYGFYFWYSGRVWCRWFCPLAALMHIYARFSRFRIFSDKKKCISCNVCTSVCHMGIDVMNFANRGRPMEDPECVRCSACVQSCPTGVLSFGQVNAQGQLMKQDTLPASPIQEREKRQGISTPE